MLSKTSGVVGEYVCQWSFIWILNRNSMSHEVRRWKKRKQQSLWSFSPVLKASCTSGPGAGKDTMRGILTREVVTASGACPTEFILPHFSQEIGCLWLFSFSLLHHGFISTTSLSLALRDGFVWVRRSKLLSVSSWNVLDQKKTEKGYAYKSFTKTKSMFHNSAFNCSWEVTSDSVGRGSIDTEICYFFNDKVVGGIANVI